MSLSNRVALQNNNKPSVKSINIQHVLHYKLDLYQSKLSKKTYLLS